MYGNKLQLHATESAITKDERYELIALIAQRYSEPEPLIADVEVRRDLHCSEMEMNFDEFVSPYK
jgi:hypothetical protein